YLEHLPAPDGFRKQFENGELQRGPFENVRGNGRRRAEVREMNLAVVGVKYRKARGLYAQEVERAVKYALDDFCEVRACVDVVCDFKQRFVYARFFLLLAVDVRVAVADGDLLREVANEIYL